MAHRAIDSPLKDDYLPRHRDSALALVRPESSFLEFFKQSLLYTSKYCTDPQCCTFFDSSITSNTVTEQTDAETESHHLRGQSSVEVTYPLALFEDLRELPSAAALHNLAQQCQSKILHSVPFLPKISCMDLEEKDLPFYLLLPKALLGTTVTRYDQLHLSRDKLWHACTSLITGTVEVDNTLGRTVVWHTAAILIITFGCMQADSEIWRQTEIVTGFVQSTLYRPGFITNPIIRKASNVAIQHAAESDISTLRSLYFLVDTLRSIHFHTPSTVDATWSVQVGTKAEYDFRAVCEGLLLDKRAPPLTLSIEEYLLILNNILSDTNTLLCTLGPLTRMCSSIREHIRTLCCRSQLASHLVDSRQHSATSMPLTVESLTADYNPHIPFTADYEYSRLRGKLVDSLGIWESSFRSRSTGFSAEAYITDSKILPLFYFCRLLLETGPALYITASLSGYMPESYDGLPSSLKRPCEPHTIGIQFGDSALQIAMEILESVEADSSSLVSTVGSSSDHQGQRCRPMWYPIVLFYGAMVVWGRLSEEATKKNTQSHSTHNHLTQRRLLQAFHIELQRLKNDWNCAIKMALVVGSLIH